MKVSKKELEFLKENYPVAMHRPTNEERAERAFRTLRNSELNRMCEEDRADTFVDLVTDLLHLAYQYGVEPDYIIRMASAHYDAEVEEEAGL